MERTHTTGAPDQAYDVAGLQLIRGEAIRAAIDAVFALAIGVLVVAALVLDKGDPNLLLVIIGLTLAAALARGIYRFMPQLAAVCLVLGLGANLVLALALLPAAAIAPWLSFIPLLAGALLGWRSGSVTMLVATGASLWGLEQSWIPLPTSVMLSIVLLGWCGLFVSWLLLRPTSTALNWAWNSYQQAFALTQEARERQAELARLTKMLGESYYHLEQVNLDLDRARRLAHEARRLKEQFAAAVSHELRTPLNLIIGFCEMMVLAPASTYGQRLPAAYRDDIEAIYRNACHISALVDDILDLSQIDADRMALHREWTTVAEIVHEATTPVARLIYDRGLYLRTALADDLPSIFVDRTRIRQILINLLNNAARVIDSGGVTISARCDGPEVVIAVSDTGPGIAAKDLPYVFEEFQQFGDLGSRRGRSGLGLALSRRFAELHRGTLDVQSTLGKGTTFTLRLPIDDACPVTRPTRSWEDRLAARIHGQAERRLLVLDDAGEATRIFRRYLDEYHVLSADDLIDGRHAAAGSDEKREPVQAVILGSASARQQFQHLARARPELRQLPIIECPLHTIRRAAEELGVREFLVKPITRDQLRAVLRRLPTNRRDSRVVLAVDDDPEMLRLLGRMVRSISRRYDVLTAEDGEQALRLLREQRPDVVLLDLFMPTVDGYALLDAMRADPSLRDVPVLVVTALGTPGEVVKSPMLSVTREDGLTVAEVMRWVKAGLDALLAPGTIAQAPPATPSG